MFSVQQNWKRRGQNRGSRGDRKGEMAQTMYTHVGKCKNDKKIFFEKKKRRLFT
jgi:hypothetical protein